MAEFNLTNVNNAKKNPAPPVLGLETIRTRNTVEAIKAAWILQTQPSSATSLDDGERVSSEFDSQGMPCSVLTAQCPVMCECTANTNTLHVPRLQD